MRKWTVVRGLIGAAGGAALLVTSVPAQQATPTVSVSAERAMVSRAELEASLKGIEENLASKAYSTNLRTAKTAQAEAIRDRLSQGDLRVGDLIRLDVPDMSSISNNYQVSANRTITLPGAIEISVAGLLRSELQGYLTTQLKKLVRDPTVVVVPTIRISVFGAVTKPGFITPPATTLLSDVIQQFAGGPANNVRWEKSKITRGDKVVVDGAEFRNAVNSATTIDQLNLQAGDVLEVGTKPAGGLGLRLLGVVGSLSSLIWVITRFNKGF